MQQERGYINYTHSADCWQWVVPAIKSLINVLIVTCREITKVQTLQGLSRSGYMHKFTCDIHPVKMQLAYGTSILQLTCHLSIDYSRSYNISPLSLSLFSLPHTQSRLIQLSKLSPWQLTTISTAVYTEHTHIHTVQLMTHTHTGLTLLIKLQLEGPRKGERGPREHMGLILGLLIKLEGPGKERNRFLSFPGPSSLMSRPRINPMCSRGPLSPFLGPSSYSLMSRVNPVCVCVISCTVCMCVCSVQTAVLMVVSCHGDSLDN